MTFVNKINKSLEGVSLPTKRDCVGSLISLSNRLGRRFPKQKEAIDDALIAFAEVVVELDAEPTEVEVSAVTIKTSTPT